MRHRGRVVAGLLLAAACTSTPTTTGDGFQATAPTFQSDETPTSTMTVPGFTTTTEARVASLSSERTRGALPNGTVFDLYSDPPLAEDVTEIFAPVILDIGDGSSWMMDVTFSARPIDSPRWVDSTYLLPAGDVSIAIQIDAGLVDRIGPDYRSVVETGIESTTVSGWPVLILTAPFRWPTADEPWPQVEIDLETISIESVCGATQISCSTDHSIGLAEFRDAGPEPRAWRIEAPLSGRSAADPYFLDPGPLGPRINHDLVWTGEEMVVWGGASGDRIPHLVEGAAFNPRTNEWRMLPPSPMSVDQATRAIWAGDEMVVMSQEAIVAYSPMSGSWSVIGTGVSPALIPGMTAAENQRVYSWTPSGIIEVDLETGWRALPDPGFGGDQAHEGALRIFDGRLHAIGVDDGPCGGRVISEWTGSDWRSLPNPPLATADQADCSQPAQTAVSGGLLIVWEDNANPTLGYGPKDNRWHEIARIPLPGNEGAPGPVVMDGGFLVPGLGEAAIYHRTADRWQSFQLENPSTSSEMLWTGDQILMWGAACCNDDAGRFRFQDAWRWTPPE